MAKKKSMDAVAILYSEPSVYDNRGPGVMDKPNESIRGCRYPKGKILMEDFVAKGESARRPDVNMQTANGTSHSFGQNPDQQRNWSPTSAWAEDQEWTGGNMSGM